MKRVGLTICLVIVSTMSYIQLLLLNKYMYGSHFLTAQFPIYILNQAPPRRRRGRRGAPAGGVLCYQFVLYLCVCVYVTIFGTP